MIRVTVTGEKEVTAMLSGAPDRVRAKLEQTFQRIGYGLQRHIQSEKLSGQVLKQRSGRLRESIHPEFINTPSLISTKVGTNVQYAAAHEYGFVGTVQVKEHMRKGVPVKAHPMKMNLRERSFMRTSLREYYTTAMKMIERDIHTLSGELK